MLFNKEYYFSLFHRYPELLAFLTKGVDATNDYNITEMAPWMVDMYQAAAESLVNANERLQQGPLASLVSTASTGLRSIELERTLLCIMAMQSVADENYAFFENNPVPFGKPITREQFDRLHQLMLRYFPAENQELLLQELVLGDLGKIRPLRETLCQQLNITEQDPDQFLFALLSFDHERLAGILPSMAHLTEHDLNELRKTNTGFHYGHFAHTESTERELMKLKAIIADRGVEYLYKNLLVQVFDVAGAAAQDRGKILLNTSVASTYLDDILPTLLKLESESAEAVYNSYLVKRLQKCNILSLEQAEEKLDPVQRLLGRLICMFRLYTEVDARLLKNALDHLSDHKQFISDLVSLDHYQAISTPQVPTYMPALLNALKASSRIMELAEEGEDNPQLVALRIGLRLIANAINLHEQLINKDKMAPQNPINFNGLTGLVKSDFEAIKTLSSDNQIAFGKKDGIVYPMAWIIQNKSLDPSHYLNQHGSLDNVISSAKAIQFWYRRTRDENKVLAMIEDRENSSLAANILQRRT